MLGLQEILALAFVAAVAGGVAWRRWVAPRRRPTGKAGPGSSQSSGSCSQCAFARDPAGQTKKAPQAGPSGKRS